MKQHHPPRLAEKIFSWYCGLAKIEDLQGDTEEIFYHNLKTKSPLRAKLIYCKQVTSLIFSYAIRKRKKDARYGVYSSHSFHFAMLRNYIKIAVRNIYRHKYFSLINVIGLSIGMSVSLLLISLLAYVKSYDDFHLNKNHIYTISSHYKEGVEEYDLSSSPIVLADKIKNEFAGAEQLVRINSSFNGKVVLKNENIPLRGYYADPGFLSLFTFHLLEGNPSLVLSQANSIVLTETAAIKLFGRTDVVGKIVEMEDAGSFQVTGLLKDYSKNSHLKFEALVSYSSLPVSTSSAEDQWTNYRNQYIYVYLPDAQAENKMQDYLNRVAEKTYTTFPTKVTFVVRPLNGLVTKDLRNAIGPKWEASGFWVFGLIALLILLPACFNYTNISIARALKRSKEIGLRKTMGGQKDQIFIQFLMETIIITLISLVGALLLFLVGRSEFQSMLVDAASTDLSLNVKNVALFVVFALLTGTIAGILPAFYFARLNPIQALKSQVQGNFFSGMRLRKILTAFQFALTFGFILCLVVFGRQYRYSLHYDFGFHKENILNVALKHSNAQIAKTEFSKIASVQAVSLSSGRLGLGAPTTRVRHTDSTDSSEVAQLFIDDQFIPNFGLKLIAGSNFQNENFAEEQSIIVNEQFLKAFKVKHAQDVIGQTYSVDGKELKVIGVLNDFHFSSLMVPIKPFFFRTNPAEYQIANLKIVSDDAYGSVTAIENAWKGMGQDEKMEARFFDDEIDEAYDFYETLLKIVGFLGLLALSISLLGLLGMVVYTSENRTKEVGIRKVMGASNFSITVLLSREYIKMMLIASAIAIPITIAGLEFTLPNIQHYYTSVNAWDVLLSLFILLAMGLATLSSQTLKTASTNPADTLKQE